MVEWVSTGESRNSDSDNEPARLHTKLLRIQERYHGLVVEESGEVEVESSLLELA